MQPAYIIVGQGISGTFLSYFLLKEKINFLVIDDNNKTSSSKIAAGIINPVTGRRLVTVWMANEILPFAWNAYHEIGDQLGITAISQKNIIDFFPNPFMRESFLKKIESNDSYVQAYPDQNQFNQHFHYEFGCGEIKPVYTAHLDALLPAWRQHLVNNNQLLEETFDISQLKIENNRVHYQDIIAEKIIFCDGAAGADNPFFKNLPYAPNKGEAMIVSIPGLHTGHVYKKSMLLCPLPQKDLFWLGSTYEWEFNDPYPSTAFYEHCIKVLQDWIKLPFEIVEHLAGIRPATLERRPFAGFHPQYQQVGILNGMGAKGCSLAPYFANELVQHLVKGQVISREASIDRFKKILSREL